MTYLYTTDEGVDDIPGMLSTADEGVDDIPGMLSTDDEGVDDIGLLVITLCGIGKSKF